MPRATTNELAVRLSPSPVCSSPAFIAIPSYTCLVPPILSSVAGSEHMDHGTLPSATLRPRIVCSDRYERPAAAERTRCARIAACTLALCHFLMTVALLPASSCTGQRQGRYASCAPPGSLAAAWRERNACRSIPQDPHVPPAIHLRAVAWAVCVCPGQL